ncbi:unnamed protein product [Spirodela intermedia]|uniref:Uncharacterized protein n=1 Tax=Spirodela intermedia TaxID=51605 RepID=A0A7I8JLE2_SPIIN|nr:unnamed protein product [Spirodela intermedia]CAA6670625.1 unnamed protein product [Spirodela intermedia]
MDLAFRSYCPLSLSLSRHRQRRRRPEVWGEFSRTTKRRRRATASPGSSSPALSTPSSFWASSTSACSPVALSKPIFPPSSPQAPAPAQTPHPTTTTIAAATDDCDYSVGQWVRAAAGPQYNGSSCATIKDGQNCMAHGRPDAGYLYWRWQPQGCSLPPFDAVAFLHLLRDRHVAFVGDSMARNQLDDGEEGKFRRWRFPSHNATVSVFWSPFLVEGVEKSAAAGLDHNELFLDEVDRRWAAELGSIHWVVLSVGHCSSTPPSTTISAAARCWAAITARISTTPRWASSGLPEGLQDGPRRRHRRLCPQRGGGDLLAGALRGGVGQGRGLPEDGALLAGGEATAVDGHGVKKAAAGGGGSGGGGATGRDGDGRDEARRPPGPYMRAFPFAGGATERVQNDCVHWCLPGPVDAWNEILLQLVRRRSLAVGGGGR